jgi:hypothetical protein
MIYSESMHTRTHDVSDSHKSVHTESRFCTDIAALQPPSIYSATPTNIAPHSSSLRNTALNFELTCTLLSKSLTQIDFFRELRALSFQVHARADTFTRTSRSALAFSALLSTPYHVRQLQALAKSFLSTRSTQFSKLTTSASNCHLLGFFIHSAYTSSA